jgi:hypothetical protein
MGPFLSLFGQGCARIRKNPISKTLAGVGVQESGGECIRDTQPIRFSRSSSVQPTLKNRNEQEKSKVSGDRREFATFFGKSIQLKDG